MASLFAHIEPLARQLCMIVRCCTALPCLKVVCDTACTSCSLKQGPKKHKFQRAPSECNHQFTV